MREILSGVNLASLMAFVGVVEGESITDAARRNIRLRQPASAYALEVDIDDDAPQVEQ